MSLEIRAGITIDASGDAEAVAMAGFPSFVGDDGRVQNPTMIFRLGGVDIARSPWPIELHTGAQPHVEWLLDDVYEIPFGCFVPELGEGLLVAGRCLSAEHEAVASARVTAQCFSYGHAIGHAADMCLEAGCESRALAGEDVRERVNRDGARLEGAGAA